MSNCFQCCPPPGSGGSGAGSGGLPLGSGGCCLTMPPSQLYVQLAASSANSSYYNSYCTCLNGTYGITYSATPTNFYPGLDLIGWSGGPYNVPCVNCSTIYFFLTCPGPDQSNTGSPYNYELFITGNSFNWGQQNTSYDNTYPDQAVCSPFYWYRFNPRVNNDLFFPDQNTYLPGDGSPYNLAITITP